MLIWQQSAGTECSLPPLWGICPLAITVPKLPAHVFTPSPGKLCESVPVVRLHEKRQWPEDHEGLWHEPTLKKEVHDGDPGLGERVGRTALKGHVRFRAENCSFAECDLWIVCIRII